MKQPAGPRVASRDWNRARFQTSPTLAAVLRVLAFLSQAHVEPDLTIEIFLIDGPLAGFGALELVDPPPSDPGGGDN